MHYINFLLNKGLLVKIIPRILVSASICATLGISGIITGVSVIINDEPITLYEVYKYSEKYKISRNESLNLLVREKLEQSEMKRLRIDADIFEVDQYIEKLANNNGMSQFEFLNMLKSKNIQIDEYKDEIKSKIKKDKLYRNIFADKQVTIEEKELHDFYTSNPDQFKVANSFDVTAYSATDGNALVAIMKNPMIQPQGVQVTSQVLQANTLNDQLKALLNSTKNGEFSKIININNNPTMFYLKEKNNFETIPFESVKQSIYQVLSKQKEESILTDYFEKVKSSASIDVVRSPS